MSGPVALVPLRKEDGRLAKSGVVRGGSLARLPTEGQPKVMSPRTCEIDELPRAVRRQAVGALVALLFSFAFAHSS